MTSADIRFSWEAARNPDVAWVSSSIVDFIKDVEIHSDKEFTVHYTKAQPYNIMDINDVTIVPKHTFGKVPFGQWSGYGEWAELANQAAGGPWMLERHDPGQEIVLQRNPEFWDEGKPYLERLIFKIFGNMGSMLNALLAGQLDIMNGIQPDQAQRVVDDRDLFLYTYVARSYGYVGWNCKRFPFDDRLVRQAMTYAINRFDIVEGQFYGFATVAGPNLLRSIWASDRSLEPYPYDPARA
jgi:ABC-type transport system substrate-binding protein